MLGVTDHLISREELLQELEEDMAIAKFRGSWITFHTLRKIRDKIYLQTVYGYVNATEVYFGGFEDGAKTNQY